MDSMNDLKVSTQPVITQGPVYYDNMSRVFNEIRLKRRLLQYFGSMVKEKGLCYRTELYPNFEQLIQRIQEIKQNKGAMPILLFLTR